MSELQRAMESDLDYWYGSNEVDFGDVHSVDVMFPGAVELLVLEYGHAMTRDQIEAVFQEWTSKR